MDGASGRRLRDPVKSDWPYRQACADWLNMALGRMEPDRDFKRIISVH